MVLASPTVNSDRVGCKSDPFPRGPKYPDVGCLSGFCVKNRDWLVFCQIPYGLVLAPSGLSLCSVGFGSLAHQYSSDEDHL